MNSVGWFGGQSYQRRGIAGGGNRFGFGLGKHVVPVLSRHAHQRSDSDPAAAVGFKPAPCPLALSPDMLVALGAPGDPLREKRGIALCRAAPSASSRRSAGRNWGCRLVLYRQLGQGSSVRARCGPAAAVSAVGASVFRAKDLGNWALLIRNAARRTGPQAIARRPKISTNGLRCGGGRATAARFRIRVRQAMVAAGTSRRRLKPVLLVVGISHCRKR